MKILSIYPNFKNKGGAQNVVVQLARHLNDAEALILTNTPISEVPQDYRQAGLHFVPFTWRNVLRSADKDTILFSHHRRSTTLLLLLRCLLRRRWKVVHVAHNTFHSLKWFSLFPKHIVAVSEGVKDNLVQYFGLPPERVKVIYNGLADRATPSQAQGETIKVLLLGRITAVKQQLELVKQTKGRLPRQLRIDFAGEGENQDPLQRLITNDSQFRYLGQVAVEETLPYYDYVCLFSQKEGLPLSLIESCMFAKPLITNNLAAVQEVNRAGYNGWVFASWHELVEGLQQLPTRESERYQEMSRNARQQYESLFTETKMIKEYRSFLSRIKLTK